jgi:hypothetical protein
MSLILLLNPKQYGGAVTVDTSDVWRKRRRKLQEFEDAEESLAIEKLLANMNPVDNYLQDDKVKLHKLLTRTVSDKYTKQKEKERNDRLLLLLLLSDD